MWNWGGVIIKFSLFNGPFECEDLVIKVGSGEEFLGGVEGCIGASGERPLKEGAVGHVLLCEGDCSSVTLVLCIFIASFCIVVDRHCF